jgi:uroporphyrinogen decarboxylase
LDWLKGQLDVLPPTMKILVHNADVFTYAWELLGFSPFCLASLEQPGFIRELMQSLATAQLNATRAAAALAGDQLGALFYSDDIAYTEGLMLSPDFYREFLFPTIAAFGQIGAAQGAPLIYHTDGRLYDVFDDLANVGVRAIQPLEPKAMDPREIQRRWPGKFCLLGNVDLDLMSRGTPDAVEDHVRDRIDTLNARGGYMPGVSNTVPDYVRTENYLRMIETVYGYPQEQLF